MFNNLIESTSHAKEFKRRGSFLLFTCATYCLLFVITGVASIYAYDARLEEQNLEVVTLLPPQELVTTIDPQPAAHPDRPRDTRDNTNTLPERATAMLSVNHPESVPPTVGTTPNKNLPLPEHGAVRITGRDREGSFSGPESPFTGGRTVVAPRQIVPLTDQPPPPPDPPKAPKVVSKGVITGLAISLPKPVYSEMAKRIRLQGAVSVQVLVDETGHVLSAKALGGHPLLSVECQKAALRARFAPTILNDQPVKVSGVITYNFVLSN